MYLKIEYLCSEIPTYFQLNESYKYELHVQNDSICL